jgi:hypothetical protein
MIDVAGGADDHWVSSTATSKPCKLAFLAALRRHKTLA